MRRPPSFGCGVVRNLQFNDGVAMAAQTQAGMWMKGCVAGPPASITQTVHQGSSDKRFASTQPAVPAPTMT